MVTVCISKANDGMNTMIYDLIRFLCHGRICLSSVMQEEDKDMIQNRIV